MLSLLKLLLVRYLLARYVAGTLGSLVVAVPVAALLKIIGIPLLIILGVVALPILVILLTVGLPVFGVLLSGAALIGFVGLFVAMGGGVLKVGFFVVLPIVLVIWFVRFVRGSGQREGVVA